MLLIGLVFHPVVYNEQPTRHMHNVCLHLYLIIIHELLSHIDNKH